MMDLKTRYKVKGIGMEKVIESVVVIKTEEKGEKGDMRIVGVEDRWGGEILEGPIATVSSSPTKTKQNSERSF